MRMLVVAVIIFMITTLTLFVCVIGGDTKEDIRGAAISFVASAICLAATVIAANLI